MTSEVRPRLDRVWARLSRIVPLIGPALLCVAAWAVHRELEGIPWGQVHQEFAAVPLARWAAALGLVAVSYAALAGGEWLATRHAGLRLQARQVLLTGAVGWAISNTVGQSWLSGGTVRLRSYSAEGVGPADVARILAFETASFALGAATVGGLALAIEPPDGLPPGWRVAGAALVGLVALWVALGGRRTMQWTVGPIPVRLPRGWLLVGQVALASLDEIACVGILYLLLPPDSGLSPIQLAPLFVISLVAGVLSGLPGGAGTFDGTLVVLLSRYTSVSAPAAIGAVLGWRLIYDLLPLGLATVALAGFELRQLRLVPMERIEGFVGALTRSFAPPALAGLSFVGGLVLLVSAFTPAVAQRLSVLADLAPLGLIETSHAGSAAVGVALLFVARGLWMRVRAAWTLLVGLLLAGGLLSLAKGLDFEEALFLLGVLVVALPARHEFYRPSALGKEAVTLPWAVAVGGAVAGTGLVLVHAYVHVPFSPAVGLTFAEHAEASRSFRAFALAGTMAGAAVMMSWLRPVRWPAPAPSPEEIDDAVVITVAHGVTNGWLAALGDKALLFDRSRRAFLMYGSSRGVWVCYAGPIGPPELAAELLWAWREHAHRAGARIALYEIGPELLPTCVDLGLQVYKFGEEAIVPIAGFSLEGGANKGRRNQISKIEREGASFAVLEPAEVGERLAELAAVSDAWLGDKRSREKSFSLGFFDEGYVRRCPVAVVQRDGAIVAFANLLQAPPELSIDLMRFHPDAPPGAMDYLFLCLFRWGSERGFQRFVLGMTPLAGLPDRDLAPLWAKLGQFVFRNGEAFYNFQGLREYKDKFHPGWEPRYLAAAGILSLPATLRAINALVSVARAR